MNKFFYLIILSFISLSANAMHRIVACNAIRSSNGPKRMLMPARSGSYWDSSECNKVSLPLAKAIRERKYEKMLHALPNYKESLRCYASGDCCLIRELNILEEELKQNLVVVQAVKIHRKKLTEQYNAQEEEYEKWRDSQPRKLFVFDSDINRR